ncbi:MAG TPA: PQQ-dependent sugar dehydrogenase [Acidimicrobiales bacterium]|nr:PQQ-dependent sugar dehydrogenase [Acidimicrobiales bacterium]
MSLLTTLTPRRCVAAVALGTLLATTTACGDDDDESSGGEPIQGQLDQADPPTTDAEGTAVVPLDEVDLTLTSIGSFDAPISIINRADDPALYVVGWNGTVTKVDVAGEGDARTYEAASEPLIDIDDDVVTEGEEGLLDATFSPDGARLYVSYTAEPDGHNVIASYEFDGESIDEGSRREILTAGPAQANHNGGDIAFGPDGFLYFGLGDGGGGGDPDSNGQDTETQLGKLMRIDPEGAVAAGDDEPYLIPADNPFADGGGSPEVWAYGLRNPWRFSFDPANGDLWIGDVGQGEWEEIDWLPATDGTGAGRGANLGWNAMEGSHPFEGGSNPDGAVLPVYEYANGDDGCAVTGGVVYRGPATSLEGIYLFGDSCQNYVRAIRLADGEVVDEGRFEDASVEQLVSFGTDNGGDVYVVGLGGGEIFRIGAS